MFTILIQCFQGVLREVEKQQGRMDDILAEHEDLRPTKTGDGDQHTKEDKLADELAQLKDDTAERIKRLQVHFITLEVVITYFLWAMLKCLHIESVQG